MSSASEKLEAHRREAWRRLREDSGRLASDVQRTGSELVKRHPYIAMFTAGVVGTCAAGSLLGRSAPGTTPSKRARGFLNLGMLRLARSSFLGGLSAAMNFGARTAANEESAAMETAD